MEYNIIRHKQDKFVSEGIQDYEEERDSIEPKILEKFNNKYYESSYDNLYDIFKSLSMLMGG